jgi:hypothetical protein
MAVTVTVAVSPTGSVYTPAYTGSSVTHLVPSGPGLAFGGCVANGGANGCTDPPQDALSGAIGVTLSRDGRYLYSSSNQGVSSFALEQPADRTAPETTLGKHPKKKTTSKKAKFTFTSSEAGTFQCKVDKKKAKPCTSPFKVKAKRLGKHKFSVFAVDAAGNVDASPATYKWKVVKKKPHR